jgi:AraC family transcriptional regulator
MIPRQNMQQALEHVTGKPTDDEQMCGHIGTGSVTLLRIGQLLRQEHANPTKGSADMLESMTDILCIELARQFGHRSNADSAPDAYAPLDETQLDNMMAKAIPGEVLISDIADAFGILPYQFTRRFKAQFGETPREHLMRRRLEHARQMLSETLKPLAEIAFECGFSSQAHMTSTFSKTYGTSPGRIRCDCDTT